jgi:hypothetical protein
MVYFYAATETAFQMSLSKWVHDKIKGPTEVHESLRSTADTVIEISTTVKVKREELEKQARDFPISGFLLNQPPRKARPRP